jgi:hypothetical protein
MVPDLRLRELLHRFGLRLRVAESLSWSPWGAAVGLGLSLLLALATRLWPMLVVRHLVAAAGLLALVGASVGLAVSWLRPHSLSRLAFTFDRRFGLAERLVTAVEIGDGRLRTSRTMAEAQLADTLAVAARVVPRSALPLRASRPALLACAAVVAALVLSLWLPNPRQEALVQEQAVRAEVEERIGELEAVRAGLDEVEGLDEVGREMLLQALDEAISALERSLDVGGVTPEEALAALAEAEQALAELDDPGAAAVEAGLDRAAGEMADSELMHEIAEALAAGDYARAAEELAAYAGDEGRELSREEELELSRELAAAAEALAGSDAELAERLAEAVEAIERGDLDEAREAIRAAAEQLGAAGDRVERQQAMEGALAGLQEGREQVVQAAGARPGEGEKPSLAGVSGQPGGQPSIPGVQTQPGHHEDAGSAAPYDEVYVPSRLGEEGLGVNVGREGEDGVGVGEAPHLLPEEGRANVPYREVYADYAEQAGVALEGSHIPLGYKDLVRDYFSSLEP